MAQPVFIITIREVEAAVGATALGTEVSGYGGRVGGFHQVIQLQALNALGVELAGGIVETGVFRRSRITFSCSRPLCIASPSRNTEKLCCIHSCSALRIATGSSPERVLFQRLRRSSEPSISDSLASRSVPCSAMDSCRCRPPRGRRLPGRATSCRPDGWRRGPIRRRFRLPRTGPGSPRLRPSHSRSTPGR